MIHNVIFQHNKINGLKPLKQVKNEIYWKIIALLTYPLSRLILIIPFGSLYLRRTIVFSYWIQNTIWTNGIFTPISTVFPFQRALRIHTNEHLSQYENYIVVFSFAVVQTLYDDGSVHPLWLLWLAVALGILFLIMLIINIFLCSAMTCSCTRTDIIEKEPSIIEDYDPYRSWHGSQYGSRFDLIISSTSYSLAWLADKVSLSFLIASIICDYSYITVCHLHGALQHLSPSGSNWSLIS